MNSHDTIKALEKEHDSVAKISEVFKSSTQDLEEIMDNAEDPRTLAALLFKVAQEREKTNKVLESINDKYDQIMLQLKTGSPNLQQEELKGTQYEILPEQDKLILEFIGEREQGTAHDIMSVLNYSGLNGASQRLNKLCREGYLQKVRSGKKVLYLLRH